MCDSVGSRVFILGLDGASSNLLFPAMEGGLFPNLERLFDDGLSGELESTIPPYTCPAWVSSVTGVNPGRHGVFDFFLDYDLQSKQLKYANSATRKVKAIWNILDGYGKSSVLLNVPVTYPVEKINGVMISGLLSPNINYKSVHPKELINILFDMDYQIDLGPTMLDLATSFMGNRLELLGNIEELMKKRFEAIFYLMDEYEWDFFMCVVVALDRIQHYFYDYMSVIGEDARDEVYNKLRHICGLLDDYIGKVVDKLDKNTHLLVYSDHGFKPIDGYLFPNNLLLSNDVLKIGDASFLDNLSQKRISDVIVKYGLDKVVKHVPQKIVRRLGNMFSSSTDFMNPMSVSNLSKAVFFGNGFIKINDEIREPDIRSGIVNKILDSVGAFGLDDLVDVYRKEDVYHGETMDSIPDIIMETKGNLKLSTQISKDDRIVVDRSMVGGSSSFLDTGQHGKYGVFIYYDKNLETGRKVLGAKIVDVAPTICSLMGLEPPDYYEGKSLI